MAATPSFEPRKLLVRPRVWGVDPDAKAAEASSLDGATRAAWALRQNVCVCALNELKDFHGNTTADVAAVLGGSPSQLGRKLSGKSPASFGDLAKWEWLIRRGTQAGQVLVSETVARAMGLPWPALDAVAGPSVALPFWPLPKGNQRGGRDWTRPHA